MEDVEVPSYFLCPISLQIMRDPVALPTGITYDREGIERWLSCNKSPTCPVTNQPMPKPVDLTPNHTLRRLIQAWCTANAFRGVERFPTPRPPVDRALLASLIEDARLPHSRLAALKRLKKLVSDSESNKRVVATAASGVVDFLLSVVTSNVENAEQEHEEEALSILHALQLSGDELRLLLDRNHGLFEALTATMRKSNFQSRAYAVLLAKSAVSVSPPDTLLGLPEEFFKEVMKVLRDRVSHQATCAALKVLYAACQWGWNTAKAVEVGAVKVLVELLLDEPEKKESEMMLVLLDNLCRGPKGAAQVVSHAAGVAVVSRSILRVTPGTTERAVRVLHSISRHAATPEVVEDMAQVGVVSKLCLLLSGECERSTRETARDVLRMHSRVWRRSPCVSPPQLKVLSSL
ncbi:hypothetical protein HPP92_026214 [Vanilla planifolia]|uniref:U-box domain-containing protein n=1 Tax=Vanilla planifolia TaxID=51239 RepID=A0A835PHF6_VANPL|nr:hypothetical protein HPP92_026214 [Vanilla planifolia]